MKKSPMIFKDSITVLPHGFFNHPMCFSIKPKEIHHPQQLTPYPPLPKPSFFILTWIILPIPFPKGGIGNTAPLANPPPQPNMPVNTSHQRQSTQGFPYRSLHFSLARPTDGWITASCPKGQTSPC